GEDLLFVSCRIDIASPTSFPRIKSKTSLTLRGAILTVLATAFACMFRSSFITGYFLSFCFLVIVAVTFESSCWCELSKFVSDHIFCNVNRYVLAAVIDCDCVPDKVREDR